MNSHTMRAPSFAAAIIAAAFALAGGASLAGQEAAASADEEALFGEAETVVQAAEKPAEGGAQAGFLKYDQVKVGGSLTGNLGFASVWPSAWDGSAELLDPGSHYITPSLQGKITLVAKPSESFGVNMDFRTSWPFQASHSFLNSATYIQDIAATPADESAVITKSGSVSVPNISVWSLYSKFNWHDKVYFSFGKQPLSWGVSKGAFQPADDIFALSPDIDLTDTGAEREGPVSLKTTVPIGVTNNFYLYAGLPADAGGSVKVDPADARLAVKGEFGFGNTEMALGAFYSYNDHPRALVMVTTGIGNWNLYGEGILKYGSERYFLAEGKVISTPFNPKGVGGDQESGKFYLAGTGGGYYTNPDGNLTLAMAYMYNGEGQPDVSAKEWLTYYAANSANIDRIKFGTHYAFASLTRTEIVKNKNGDSKLSASLIAIANLSDLSGYVMPSITWTFFDYMSLKVGATFNFGEAGDEYIVYGVGGGMGASDKPGAALNITLSLGSGAF